MRLRVALVGCGRIADGHLEQVRSLSRLARMVAVCDREPLMAEQAASRHHVPRFYQRFDEMLERERPDVVHIATSPPSHVPLALRAMEAGCHVLVEKPIAPDHEAVVRLVEHANRSARLLTVGYTYRFDPPAVRARALVSAGAIGEVVHLESFYGYDLDGPYGRVMAADPDHWVHRLPGGLLHNNLDHPLEKVVEYLDDEPVDVTTTAYARGSRKAIRNAESFLRSDELRISLRAGRTSAYVTVSCHSRPVGHYLAIYGTRATLRVDLVRRTVVVERPTAVPGAPGRALQGFFQTFQLCGESIRNIWDFSRSRFHFFAGLRTLLEAFYRALLGGGPPPVPYRHIIRVSELLDRVFPHERPLASLAPVALSDRGAAAS